MESPSYSVDGFAEAEDISRSMVYKLWKQGKGPRFYMVGTVRRITHEVNWVMDPAQAPFAGKPHWEIEVDGLPGVRIAMDLVDTAPDGVRTKPEQFAVAAMVLQAIPRVVAAPPGLLRL